MTDDVSEPAGGAGEAGGRVAAEGGVAPADAASGATEAAPPGTWTPPAAKPSKGRSIAANGVIGIATLLLIVGVFAVWANRLLFSPANWSNTSTQLLQNPTIRSTLSNYTVDQLYAHVNVGNLIKSALPTRLQPLADPAAGALQNVAVQGVNLALERPRVQDLWARANKAAAQTFLVVVKGGNRRVGVKQGVVTLNLASIVDSIASRLGLPPNLGAKLPHNIAHLTVLKSDQLKLVQNGGDFLRHLAVWLTVIVPVLYAVALAIAPPGRRRRTLLTVGLSAVLGGLVVILCRSILVTQVTGSLVKDASLKPAVGDAVAIMTQMLHQIAAGIIFMGVLLVLAAVFAGPLRPAYATRRAIAPFLRERPVASYAIALGLLALLFIWNPIHATGTPAGIIVFTVVGLFGMFILRRQTAEEFPEARSGDTARRIRAWVDRRRQERQDRRRPEETPATATTSLADQLHELADLRDRGAIGPDEYEAAKGQLLSAHR
ncbi:MAG: SHOCT domain-containing protein [Solirubrobacterales bacterium]|nr:SHOCT domain-containing protein [Solirubrobacterales bacterium]